MAHDLGFNRRSNITKQAKRAVLGWSLAACTLALAAPAHAAAPACGSQGDDGPTTANVVAMDQVITYNRMGAFAPAGMIFALARDVFPKGTSAADQTYANSCEAVAGTGAACTAGNVQLRDDKRPRPLTLRVNEGCQIAITLTNLLDPLTNLTDARNEAPGIILCENDPVTGAPNDGTARPGICQSQQPATRNVSIHIHGMEPATIADDGSNVGGNATSLVAPNGFHTYTLTAKREGAYTITSGPNLGGEGGSGAIASGLFGVLNVEPTGSTWYQNQVTREDMEMAASAWQCTLCDGTDWGDATPDNKPNPTATTPRTTPDGHPILNYEAVFPDGHPYAGKPILRIRDETDAVFHNVLNAVIDDRQMHGLNHYELYPNRGEPFREFTIAFHDEVKMVQAFPEWYAQLPFTLGGVKDGFAVNYGTGGVGSEVIGNRLGVGPMHACAECKYEEFFLTAWAVGDPAMIVDVPANQGLETLAPGVAPPAGTTGAKATRAFYPDDPSNVFHGYLNDRTKVRNIHVGTEHHIFHLHAHQWNFVNRDEAGENEPAKGAWGKDQTNYLDSQGIGPGSSFTYEITFGGGGNRHKQVGDAIFHCHFYPHFAQGMWGLWRVHDVFEMGSTLDASGRVIERGLPDAEICDDAGRTQCGGYVTEYDTELLAMKDAVDNPVYAIGDPIPGGTPVPGVVPLPTKPMAPMPGIELVALEDTDTDGVPESRSTETGRFQGFPFFIAGKAGHRPPTPPTDLIEDGGLPRHIVTAGTYDSQESATSFDKVLTAADGLQLPEAGTLAERVAMAFHGPQVWSGNTPTLGGLSAFHDTYRPDGTPAPDTAGFEINGMPPQHSAPYADPCRGDAYNEGIGMPVGTERFYAASVIETPAELNKVGWHFAQQRLIVLDQDVGPTLRGERAPEPFVIRANTNDCVNFNHTNLTPSVYQLDDFQVRTPTDVIGQHIHLVKFDVTSADGAANGWNYEDATLSPHEVQERIHAFNAGTWNGGPATLTARALADSAGTTNSDCPAATLNRTLEGQTEPEGCAGARTTRQRWYADPGWRGNVFTHDHLGPSTHQQAGLYGVVLIEAKGSRWADPVDGTLYGTREDGGPTSWRADIHEPNDSYREFFLEFADYQLAYRSPRDRWTPFNDPVNGVVFPQGDGAAGGCDLVNNPTCINFNGANHAVNPSWRNEVGLPHVLQSNANPLPAAPLDAPGCGQKPFDDTASGSDGTGNAPTGCAPEAISAADPGTFVVNMRNEPLALRVRDPFTNTQAPGLAGDLSYAFQSMPNRADPRLNLPVEDWPYNGVSIQTANQGALPGDPFTPLLRAYEGDKVMLRVQVGAHEEGHNISINGVRWLQNWQAGQSGFRNSQFAGISEYFIFQVPGLQAVSGGPFADYLYQAGSAVDARWNGSWGLMRAYDGALGLLPDLKALPTNPDGKALRMNQGGSAKFCADASGTQSDPPLACSNDRQCRRALGSGYSCQTFTTGPTPTTFAGACPKDAPQRKYNVLAVRGADVLPDLDGDGLGDLVYNDNATLGELWDPTALMYVLEEDFMHDASGKLVEPLELRPGRRVEPLILRAAAGECIFVTLTNRLGPGPLDFDTATGALQVGATGNGFNSWPMIVHQFNANQVAPSPEVGMHAQLVEYEMANSDGMNVGHNPVQTACRAGDPGCPNTVSYKWYAGRILMPQEGPVDRVEIPVEYGTINLMASDPMEGSSKGLIGALVVEPAGTFWRPDGERGTDNLLTRAAVTVYDGPAACSHDTSIACERDTDCVEQLPGFCSRNPGKQCSSSADCGRREGRCELPPPTVKTCVYPTSGKKFRDFVVVHQDDVNGRFNDPVAGNVPLPTVSHEEEPEDTGMKGINYRSDPVWHRLGNPPDARAEFTRTVDYTNAFVAVPSAGEPKTPVYTAEVGEKIRLRVLKPGGHNRNSSITLHGFVWPRYPYYNGDGLNNTSDDSQSIADGLFSPENENTFWHGEQMGHGPTNHINVVPVGGCPAEGDFLYKDSVPVHVDNGEWAIVRCQASPPAP